MDGITYGTISRTQDMYELYFDSIERLGGYMGLVKERILGLLNSIEEYSAAKECERRWKQTGWDHIGDREMEKYDLMRTEPVLLDNDVSGPYDGLAARCLR